MSIVKKEKQQDLYKKFDQIDGSHPLKKILPNGHVDYPARLRKGGKLTYFNFALAKEMGLIPKSHNEEINKELEEKILHTFGIQIINEFDQMKGRVFKKEDMKKGTYMATRYLQLQHEDKKGLNSGDGRSVWMGQIKSQGKTWDISSGGTGATRLSPATSKFNRFFETGDPSISYGCGYAELDEGIATCVLSDIFQANDIKTEQTLCIIDYKNNISINVRAHNNLLRPSHMFLYLKQEDHESLTKITDYYIDKQIENKNWVDVPASKKRYDFFLQKIAERFAHISAIFEDEYIFCWLDWDGDNILMDGGIIDYGSIRQFGIFHHEYRYDDVERFSTSILEQRGKARYMVQTFIQLVDFIKTGKKNSIQSYNDHKILSYFDETFENRKNLNLLMRMGFSSKKSKQTLKRNKKLVEDFRKNFSYFERAKVKTGIVNIPDGKTCDAVFNMRTLLRELPQVFNVQSENIAEGDFLELMRSAFATEEDLEINSYRKAKIVEFQNQYKEIFKKVSSLFQEDIDHTYTEAIRRTNIINKPNRITGDAVTYIVDILTKNSKNLNPNTLYSLINDLKSSQNINPDRKVNFIQKNPKGLLKNMYEIIKENREGI